MVVPCPFSHLSPPSPPFCPNPQLKKKISTSQLPNHSLVNCIIAMAIPALYRLFFLYVEPLSTLVGAIYAHFYPATYLDLTHLPSAPPAGLVPVGTRIVLSQLANMYLAFALSEALVLRSTTDLGVWKPFLLVLLVADLGHLYSVKALGPTVYWSPHLWNAIDWGNLGFVYLGATTRIAFLSGLGLSH